MPRAWQRVMLRLVSERKWWRPEKIRALPAWMPLLLSSSQWAADDQVVVAIPVHIPSAADRVAELFITPVAAEGVENRLRVRRGRERSEQDEAKGGFMANPAGRAEVLGRRCFPPSEHTRRPAQRRHLWADGGACCRRGRLRGRRGGRSDRLRWAFTGGPSNPVELFSSDGPRRIFFEANGTPLTPGNFSSTGGTVRNKPDVAAADGVLTATPGFEILTGARVPRFNTRAFFGTSAAAPHAAAIGILMKEVRPALTEDQARGVFVRTALDIEAAGPDRDSGLGIIDAVLALRGLTQLLFFIGP